MVLQSIQRRRWVCICERYGDTVFRIKISSIFRYRSANLDMNFESNEELMASELEKQRKKLRDISYTLDQQHHLLRLIIQVSWSYRRNDFFLNFEFSRKWK